MAGYTKVELEALDKADEAFAEVIKVAKEFARQTGQRYVRTTNTWSSTSTFVTRLPSADNRWSKVHDLYDAYNNEAWECAWEIESVWNEAIAPLYERYDKHLCGKAFAETWLEVEYHDRHLDECFNEYERLRDDMGHIIEKWLDSAAEVAYHDYLYEMA